MDESHARFVVRFGPSTQEEYLLTGQVATLGREAINEIVVDDPEVSRRHARITFQADRYVIEDLDSTNGTFVNGQRISVSTPLNDGDIVDVGDVASFMFRSAVTDVGATYIEQPMEPAADGLTMPDQAPVDISQPPDAAPAAPFAPAQPPSLEPAPGGKSVPEPSEEPGHLSVGRSRRSTRRIVVGCGCLLFLAIVICGAALYFLDSYEDGTLLYCGFARPAWETIFDADRIARLCGAS